MASIKDIRAYVIAEFKKEIILQKHTATNKLLNGFYSETKEVDDGTEIIFRNSAKSKSGFLYANRVSIGRRAGRKLVPIEALSEWVLVKNFTSSKKEARSIAFAIAMKIKKEGIPTRKSQTLAPRRKNFIPIVAEKVLPEVTKMATEKVSLDIQKVLDEASKEFKNISV
jgi:hypothetical protein